MTEEEKIAKEERQFTILQNIVFGIFLILVLFLLYAALFMGGAVL